MIDADGETGFIWIFIMISNHFLSSSSKKQQHLQKQAMKPVAITSIDETSSDGRFTRESYGRGHGDVSSAKLRPKKKQITIRADFNTASFPGYIISKSFFTLLTVFITFLLLMSSNGLIVCFA